MAIDIATTVITPATSLLPRVDPTQKIGRPILQQAAGRLPALFPATANRRSDGERPQETSLPQDAV